MYRIFSMVQAVNLWASGSIPRGIYGWQSANGTRFSSSTEVFPYQYRSTNARSSLIYLPPSLHYTYLSNRQCRRTTRIILRTAQFRLLSAALQKLLNSQLGSASCTYGHQSKYSLEHTWKHYPPHSNYVNRSGRGQKSSLWSSLPAITCGRSSQFFSRYVR
jgi:hypothetical protein